MSENYLGPRADRGTSEEAGEEKRKRRHRSDEEGRNFSCSCGKSYLSYPALYTHIKTKHNGKAEYSKGNTSKEENEEEAREEEEEEIDKSEDVRTLDTLRRYLNKFFPFTHKDREAERRVKELGKEELGYLKEAREYWDKHKKEEEYQLNDTYATSIDHVLGKFLLDIESELSRNSLRFLQEFVVNLRNGLNQIQGDEKFSKSSCASELPLLMNTLFSEVFQKFEEEHIYNKHPTLPCKVLYHFNRWLFQEKFTNHSLRFNTL